MTKTKAKKIVKWSAIALIVPVLGQLFVEGWDWGLGEFAFAFVFFNILGFTYTYVTEKITHKWIRIVTGAVIILFFASFWAMLARG